MKKIISIVIGIIVAFQIWSYSIKNELVTIYQCIESNLLDITPSLKHLLGSPIEQQKWNLIKQIEMANKSKKEISPSKRFENEIINKINNQIINQYILINESIKIYNKTLSHPLKKLILIKYNFQKIPRLDLNISKKSYLIP